MARVSRRRFLGTAAAVGAAGVVGPHANFAQEKKPAPSERLRLGLIGVGGQGGFHVGNARSQDVVALCDIDSERLGKVATGFTSAKTYADYRRVLDHKDIDAVIICTPDHTHACISVQAMRAGKDVYCEKPLAHSVQEVRAMIRTAAEHKRITQMGTQIHAGGNYRRVVELVQSGAIGKVQEVHVWVPTSYAGGNRPKETPPVPAHVDYDLWLGPAPERAFHPSHFHFVWRGWWDYGGGATADMACHHMDLPFWALKLGHPARVTAEGPAPHPDGCPAWLIARYEFPARGDLPPVKLTWYSGGKLPPAVLEGRTPRFGAGTLFVGEKGMLIADYGRRVLLPEKQFEGFAPPKPSIVDSIGHHKEWFEAVKTRGQTTCNFEYSGTLTQAVLLANVAFRSGAPVEWDGASGKAAGNGKAGDYLHREYRKGWTL
jgi:predicted dehydrogenase